MTPNPRANDIVEITLVQPIKMNYFQPYCQRQKFKWKAGRMISCASYSYKTEI